MQLVKHLTVGKGILLCRLYYPIIIGDGIFFLSIYLFVHFTKLIVQLYQGDLFARFIKIIDVKMTNVGYIS